MKTRHQTSIRNTFRIIQALVCFLLLFLLLQGVLLWRVCSAGAKSTQGLQREGIPSLTHVSALQRNINLYRLRSYELMFVQEKDRAAKAAEADALNRENLASLDQLQQLFPSGPGQELVSRVHTNLTRYAGTMAQLRSKMDKDFEGAMKMLDQEIPEQVNQLNDGVSKFAAYCNELAGGHITQTVASFSTIRKTALGFGSVSIGFAALAVALVTLNSGRIQRRLAEIVHQVAEGSQRVNESGNSVSSASQSLAEGASDQAASLEETSASLEEMSSMIKRNADNSTRANELAKQARRAAETGATDMQGMSQAMKDINVASDEIAKIIKTIDEIAFQTNILALNAAVEAARAGEAGMGFAVVADEVRNLAQRSAQAAKDTASKIEGAIDKITQGVGINVKVGQVLDEIVSKARQVDELVAEVATASEEQSRGITQVNLAVGQMDKITQSNAANAEESAAAAEELNGQAASLKDSVMELLQLVGCKHDSVAAMHNATPPSVKMPRHTSVSPKAAAHRNGNGHARLAPAASTTDRAEIPLEGDFKDF